MIYSSRNFIEKIFQLYWEARIIDPSVGNVVRGRARTISSLAEDLFAMYLVNNDSDIEMILVDQSVTVHDKEPPTRIRVIPDIIVLKDGLVTNLFDLKMDFGWKRNAVEEMLFRHAEVARFFRGKSSIFNYRGVKNMPCTFSPKLRYDIVAVTGENYLSGRNLRKESCLMIENKEFSKLHVLSDGRHPNHCAMPEDYVVGGGYEMAKVDALNTLNVNDTAFEEILADLRATK